MVGTSRRLGPHCQHHLGRAWITRGVRARPSVLYADPRHISGGTLRCDLTVAGRSEEHTSELQSQFHLVCRLLLEKKNNIHPVALTMLPPSFALAHTRYLCFVERVTVLSQRYEHQHIARQLYRDSPILISSHQVI